MCIYVCMSVYMRMYVCAYMCVCPCMYVYVCMYMFVRVYVYNLTIQCSVLHLLHFNWFLIVDWMFDVSSYPPSFPPKNGKIKNINRILQKNGAISLVSLRIPPDLKPHSQKWEHLLLPTSLWPRWCSRQLAVRSISLLSHIQFTSSEALSYNEKRLRNGPQMVRDVAPHVRSSVIDPIYASNDALIITTCKG